MITWKDIKEHYITTDLSLEKIANKFYYARSVVASRASKEGWYELKQKYLKDKNDIIK